LSNEISSLTLPQSIYVFQDLFEDEIIF